MPSKHLSRGFGRGSLAVALTMLLAHSPVSRAADPPLPAASAVDTSAWTCSDCPFEDDGQVHLDVDVGATHVSDSAAKFGDYTGLDREGLYPVVAASGRQSLESGEAWQAEVLDLGLDSRSLLWRGGRQGSYDVRLGYDQVPHTLFDTTRTVFSGAGTSPLELPANWVRAGNTRQMSRLDASLVPVDIGSERQALRASIRNVLGANWSTYATYRHEQHDGIAKLGASFGFSALELPAALDTVTDNVEFGLRYGGERLVARLGYEGSFFSNRRVDQSWSNPYLGPDSGALALAPDNAAHQLRGTVNFRLGERTALSATAALGRFLQDDRFLPYSTDPRLATSTPPRASLDGQVDTVHLAVSAVTSLDGLWSLLDGARLKLDARYDERDNGSPRASYRYVLTDFLAGGTETNVPYGFEQSRVGVSGDYDLRQLLRFIPASQRLRISGGWRRDEIDRTFQEASRTTEDSGWGRVSWRPAAWMDLAVKFGGANREADDYDVTRAQVGGPQNPLLRKYNMADRERQFTEGSLSLQPSATLSFIATGTYANLDYVNSKIGLQNSKERGATAAATWSPTADVSFYGQYGWQLMDTRQAGSAAFARPDWVGTTEDVFRTGGVGFRIDNIGSELGLQVDWFFANSQGDVAVRTTGTDALPSLRTRMHGGAINLTWRSKRPFSVLAGVRYEHFDADDWALDGVGPATVPTLLSLGAQAWDYDVQQVTLAFRYRFGGGEGPARPAGATEKAGD